MKNVSSTSDWNAGQMRAFLAASIIPVRIAVMDRGYPLICSVWFDYDPDEGELVCALHESSRLARLLKVDPRCGFEIAPNESPYRGVRGKADVLMSSEGAETALRGLIQRYLGDSNKSLANWLLSRVDGELKLRLRPVWVTSWDYSGRMETV